MMINVTASNGLNFKVQGKLVGSKPVRVALDHNVQCKINNGTLNVFKGPTEKAAVATSESKVKVNK
jgi:hypothetical protein